MTDDTLFTPLDAPGTVLGDEVYRALGAAILDGRLRAGERLRDVELARRLGVSRTPVREALQRLERGGLVEVSAGRWTRVSAPDDQTISATHEFAAYLMGNAVRMALRRCSAEDLADLCAHLDVLRAASAADDTVGLYEAQVAFFSAAVIAADNVALTVTMEEAELVLRRNLGGRSPHLSDVARRTALYGSLRDATASRDVDRAECLVRLLHGVQ